MKKLAYSPSAIYPDRKVPESGVLQAAFTRLKLMPPDTRFNTDIMIALQHDDAERAEKLAERLMRYQIMDGRPKDAEKTAMRWELGESQPGMTMHFILSEFLLAGDYAAFRGMVSRRDNIAGIGKWAREGVRTALATLLFRGDREKANALMQSGLVREEDIEPAMKRANLLRICASLASEIWAEGEIKKLREYMKGDEGKV